MPRSDNLYSADDSDHESFSEELSPSDGYFNRRDVPINVVHDPSMRKEDKAEDKTLIPPSSVQNRTGSSSRTSLHSILPRSLPHNYASQRNDYSSRSPSTYTPMSPMSRRREEMFSEHTLIHGPPPAYSSTPEIPQTPRQLEGRSYSTFPEHHLERGYLPGREPESMGAPIEQTPNETTPLSREPKPERASLCRKITKKILLLVLFIVVVIALTTAMFNKSSKLGEKPPSSDPPSDEPPFDADGPFCTQAKYKNDMVTYEFPVGKDLTVLQTTHGDPGQDDSLVSTRGEVRLRRLPKDSLHGNSAYFTIDVHVSDPSLEVLKSWDEDSRLLKVSTPRFTALNSARHCVSVGITAWFPEDAEFSNLLFEAATLNMRVMDDIKIKVHDRSKFATVAGQVVFPTIAVPLSHDVMETVVSVAPMLTFDHPFQSRRILVETMSGSITGSYPLLDFLGLSSEAGQISVDVTPHKVLESAPAPADLEVQTTSGSIKVNCPIRYIPPPRNYITHVHSTAGSIEGSFYIGSVSNFGTSSGGIRIDGLPVLQASSSSDNYRREERPNVFETRTISGGTRIEVLDPIFISPLSPSEQPIQEERPNPFAPVGDDEPYIVIPPTFSFDQNLLTLDPRTQTYKQKLNTLKSTHSSSTSSVEAHYPENWEGTFHAKTVSGSIGAKGDGIRIIRDRKGYGSKELLARKGVHGDDKGSWVEMSSVAGSLRFAVGDGSGKSGKGDHDYDYNYDYDRVD